MCRDCERLHERLTQQSEEMYGLRRDLRNLSRDLRFERRKLKKLRGKKSEIGRN